MLTDDKWADLPTIQCHPTLSDEDREFESDLAYMRDLVTELHVHGSVEHLTQVVTAPSPEYDIDLYLEPWPTGMDLAGDMLAAWRAGTTDLDIYAIVAGLLDAPAPGVGGEECAHCGTLWPCETGRILERIDL